MHSMNYITHLNAQNEKALGHDWSHTFPCSQNYPMHDDVTLVTQFSVNRLERFDKVVEHWSGPISVVM